MSVLVPTTTGADIPECPINVNALGGWDPNGTPSGFYQLTTRGPYRIGATRRTPCQRQVNGRGRCQALPAIGADRGPTPR